LLYPPKDKKKPQQKKIRHGLGEYSVFFFDSLERGTIRYGNLIVAAQQSIKKSG